MKASAIWIIAATFAALASASWAEEVNVYRWIDRDGVPHFTDRPPSDANAEMTGIRSQRTDPSAVQARVQQQTETATEAAQRREDSDEEREAAAEQRAETRAQRKANCQQARERLQTYSTARRLYRPLPDGEREYLTDDEIDAARSGAQQDVDEWCD